MKHNNLLSSFTSDSFIILVRFVSIVYPFIERNENKLGISFAHMSCEELFRSVNAKIQWLVGQQGEGCLNGESLGGLIFLT